MNAAAQRRLTPSLTIVVAIVAVLLLVLLVGVGRSVHWDPPRPTPPLAPARNVAPAIVPPINSYAQVWTHPLFSPDRKPMVSGSATAGVSLGDLQLTGIILTPTLRMALLRDTHGAPPSNPGNPAMSGNPGTPEAANETPEVRVREGASLPDGSWKLVEVRPRSAIFVSATGRTELKLPAGAPIDRVERPSSSGPPMRGNVEPMPPSPAQPLTEQQQRLLKLKAAILKQRTQQSGSAAGEP